MISNPEVLSMLSRLQCAPMAMIDEQIQSLAASICGMVVVVGGDDDPHKIVMHDTAPLVPEARIPGNLRRTDKAVAVIRVHGAIGQRRGSDFWASTFSEDVDDQLRTMGANPNVGAIVMDFDTPGGIAWGIPELSDTINQVKQVKPVFSLANGMAASAGFWLSSQATKAFVTPSGEVGSHGVFNVHVDRSEQLKQEGLNVTLVSAGKFKTEGNPLGPMDEAGMAERKRHADMTMDRFTTALAEGRGVTKQHVLDNFGQGRMIEAERAKKLGMIDGVATLSELLAGIIKPREGRGRPRSVAASVAIEEEIGA